MTKFRFVTLDGTREIGLTLEEAHTRLREYAKAHNLDVHIHAGGWEGNAMSSAFAQGTDPLLDTLAVVRKRDL